VLGSAKARLRRFAEAYEAFSQSAARSGRRSELRLARERGRALAHRALAADRPDEALKILESTQAHDLLAQARSRMVVSLLRREPQLGLSAAFLRSFGQGVDLHQVDVVPATIAEAARAIALGDFAEASRHLLARLRETDDPVARLFLIFAHAARTSAESPADLEALAARAVAAKPGLAGPVAVLLAAVWASEGQDALARERLARLERGSLSGSVLAHAEALAVRLGLPASSALGEALVAAYRGRSIEAGHLLDALEGARPPLLLRLRAALAASAAKARIEVADLPGAVAELDALVPAGDGVLQEAALRQARVDVDALRDALAELSLDALPRLVVGDPARALRLLERSRSASSELLPRILHDRAVAAMAACLQAGINASEELLQATGRAVDQLLADQAALAVFRLRRLELAGDAPAPPGDLGADARAKVVEALGSYLVWLLEQGQRSKVHSAIEPWAAGKREGAFGEALRRAADLVDAEVRELLEATRNRIPTLRGAEETANLWTELDLQLGALLGRLRDLRTEASLLSACEDASARCLEALAVHVYNSVTKGWLPQRIVERALTLAHAQHLKSHLLENRALMTGR
jgi:hypothetical protein